MNKIKLINNGIYKSVEINGTSFICEDFKLISNGKRADLELTLKLESQNFAFELQDFATETEANLITQR